MKRTLMVLIVLGVGILVYLVATSIDTGARTSRAPTPDGGVQADPNIERTGSSGRDPAPSTHRPAGEGRVAGVLYRPGPGFVGEERPRATVREDGMIVASAELTQGRFEIAYPRKQRGHREYVLGLDLRGSRPLAFGLPKAIQDVGRVILFPTITYAGWVRLPTGEPRTDVTVQLWRTGRAPALVGKSEPTGEDGRFVISLNERVQRLPTPQGEHWVGLELHVLADGRSLARVEAKVEGLQGLHTVTTDLETPRLSLRVVDRQSREPIPGLRYSLRPARAFDVFHPFLDEGRSGESGEVHPDWPASVPVVVLHAGSADFLLNRPAVKAATDTDLAISASPGLHTLQILRSGTREPVAGAQVDALAQVDAGPGSEASAVVSLSGATNASGIAGWPLQVDLHFDARSFRFVYWRVAYLDEHENWRVDEGTKPAESEVLDSGLVRAVAEVGSPGTRQDRELWVCLSEGGKVSDARPHELGIALLRGSETLNYFSGVPAGAPLRDRHGRLLWRFPTLGAPVDAGLDDGYSSIVTVILPGRRMQRIEVAIDDWVKASESTHPLALDAGADTRDLSVAQIRVIGVDGNPAPNTVVVLSPVGGASRKRYWVEARRVTTDPNGLALLWAAADGVPYRVVARDPISGATGAIEEFRIDNEKAASVVRLDEPQSFETTVVFRDGTHPSVLSARLVSDPPSVLPTIRCANEGGGKVSADRIPLAAYRLHVEARRSSDRRLVKAEIPAERAHRTSVVLTDVAPEMAPPPPPPPPPPK